MIKKISLMLWALLLIGCSETNQEIKISNLLRENITKFDELKPFNNGIAKARIAETLEWVYIDLNGNIVVDHNAATEEEIPNGNYVIFEDSLYGIKNKNGKVVVPPIYSSVSPVYSGLSKVVYANRISGFVDMYGNSTISEKQKEQILKQNDITELERTQIEKVSEERERKRIAEINEKTDKLQSALEMKLFYGYFKKVSELREKENDLYNKCINIRDSEARSIESINLKKDYYLLLKDYKKTLAEAKKSLAEAEKSSGVLSTETKHDYWTLLELDHISNLDQKYTFMSEIVANDEVIIKKRLAIEKKKEAERKLNETRKKWIRGVWQIAGYTTLYGRMFSYKYAIYIDDNLYARSGLNGEIIDKGNVSISGNRLYFGSTYVYIDDNTHCLYDNGYGYLRRISY